MTRYGKKKSKSKPSGSVPARASVPACARPAAGPPPPGVLLMTGDQLAALLQVSRKTIDRMAKAGTLPGRVVLNNRVLYHRPTVEGWLANLVTGERHEPGQESHRPD